MIIGVTDEPPSLVDGWVAEHQPRYPIVSLKGEAFERFLGVRFFPTAAVITPEGTLAFAGSSGEVNGPLRDALKAAKKGSIYPKVLKAALEAFREGQAARSYAVLLALIDEEELDEEEARWATGLRSQLEQLAAEAHAAGQALYREGRVFAAHERLAPFLEPERAFPVSEVVAQLVTEMKESTDFEREMAGGEKVAEAQALEREYDYEKAFDAYKAVAKKYDGTRIASLARARAQELMDGGLPGWKSTCSACRGSRERRACEKHLEKVRL